MATQLQELETLKNEVAAQQLQLRELGDLVNAKNEELEQARQEIATLTERLAALQAENDTLAIRQHDDKKAFDETLAKLEAEIETLRAENDTLKKKLADPAFAIVTAGGQPVGDASVAQTPKTKDELLAEYRALKTPAEREAFRKQYARELGLTKGE